MKVYVYKNLHKNCWSVRSREGETYGKVIEHAENIFLKNCGFRVGRVGQQRVREEKRKRVHAGVTGEIFWSDGDWYAQNAGCSWGYNTCAGIMINEFGLHKSQTKKGDVIVYDPYLHEHFTLRDSQRELNNLSTAKWVYLGAEDVRAIGVKA